MELLEAVKRLNKLDKDLTSLENWFGDLSINKKPVLGMEWVKLKRAINGVIDELAEERNELEEKIFVVAEGIEIEHAIKTKK